MTVGMPPRLSVAEATAMVLRGVTPLPGERVPLAAAHGRTLAADVVAPRDLPPWPNASMDGYAVRAESVAGASEAQPVTLRVVETIAAGAFPTRIVGRGEATRIMTGAPIPEGADSVVRMEDTDRGVATVQVRDPRDARRNVRPRGEDVVGGEVAAARGTLLTAANLGLLASMGTAEVLARRRPRVAILSTGDELVPAGEHARAIERRLLVDVNAVTLAALVEEAGGVAVPLGLTPDEPAAIQQTVSRALAASPSFDVLVTSGGVSVGDHDYTRGALRALGAELLVHRVRIRPGAPLAVGTIGPARWIGLPGNPVSAMVTFELFVRPLLRRMLGAARPFRARIRVRVGEEIRTEAPLTHFLRVVLVPAVGGELEARLTGPQGSGLITSMARADALLVVPEDRRHVMPGESLEALLLGATAPECGTPVA